MKTQQKNKSRKASVAFSYAVIPVALIVAICVFKFVMGNGANFEGGNPEGHPLPGNMLATIYKGGFIVPILMTCLLTVITFSFERFFAISKASGKGSMNEFVQKIKGLLEQNLVILATLASVSTLLGLLGTVLGMIRAFAAMSTAGAPDSTALATGISEALINTAFGIGTAAVAIIMYNFFTTKIDKLTYAIDEAGFSIVQTYAAKH